MRHRVKRLNWKKGTSFTDNSVHQNLPGGCLWLPPPPANKAAIYTHSGSHTHTGGGGVLAAIQASSYAGNLNPSHSIHEDNTVTPTRLQLGRMLIRFLSLPLTADLSERYADK